MLISYNAIIINWRLTMKLNQILLIILSIFLIAVAINTVDAAQVDNCSEDNIASSDVDVISSTDDNVITLTNDDVYASSGKTHTYKATGSSVYIKDYNPKYKLSTTAKKQINNVKKAPKKTYKLTIDDDTYQNLKYAKKTGQSDGYTFTTNYKCKVLKPVLKTKTIKKTIVNKKYSNRQQYYIAYSNYLHKYKSSIYDVNVYFTCYKGTNEIKYATIKVTKKVKQTTITKFKTAYTKVKADICYQSTNGQLSKGSHLFFYGNTFGYDFSNYVATKQNFNF